MLTSDATTLITTLCILFYFISPFLLLKSSRSHYHTHHHCTGTTTTVHARGMTIQPCPQARKPPCCHHILPLAPTPTTAIAPFAGMQVMFFFSFFLFFRPFSDQCYRDSLYPTHQVLKPPPLHHASPLKPRKSHHCHCLICRHVSKVMFFSIFFVSFLTNVTETLFILCPRSSNPPLHYIIPTPVFCPSSLTSPATTMACIHRHTSKDMFFFHFFSDQCYRDPLYPTCWVLKPLPLHHIIPTPMPRPSSLASPHHCLCLTAHKPGHLYLHHMQVHHHCHPVTVHKIHPQCQPTMCKPHCDAIPTWHARPATTLTHHTQAPLWCHLNMECKTPTLPTHCTQAPPWRHPNMECKAPPPPTSHNANMAHRTPPPCHNANMLHRTPPPHHPQHGVQNGAAVGMVVVVDSGMAAVGMAATARHSYYLRLYIFYLCNKLILFFVFCD